MFEVFSSLPIKTLSGVFIVDFKKTSHCSGVSIVEFEQVNANWVSKFFFHASLQHFKRSLRNLPNITKSCRKLEPYFFISSWANEDNGEPNHLMVLSHKD